MVSRNSINRVILIGHVGLDPEIKYTPTGSSVASFSLATNEVWVDPEKKRVEHTEWHNVIAWNKLADFATEYLQKGQLIYLEGRLQTRMYKDKEDIQRRVTEVVSTAITPLEWKTTDKKENGSADKVDTKDIKVAELTRKEDLPF